MIRVNFLHPQPLPKESDARRLLFSNGRFSRGMVRLTRSRLCLPQSLTLRRTTLPLTHVPRSATTRPLALPLPPAGRSGYLIGHVRCLRARTAVRRLEVAMNGIKTRLRLRRKPRPMRASPIVAFPSLPRRSLVHSNAVGASLLKPACPGLVRAARPPQFGAAALRALSVNWCATRASTRRGSLPDANHVIYQAIPVTTLAVL